MIDARSKYEDALAAFAVPGCRWDNKGALTYWGKAAGLSADDIIADVRAAGVKNRNAEIRRGWSDARPQFINGTPTADYTPRARKVEPPKHAGHVRNLIGDLNTAKRGTVDWVRECSPCWDFIGLTDREQTAMWFKAMFAPHEKIFAFTEHECGKPGVNIRTASDWLKLIERGGRVPGDKVVPNPFTGKIGKTTAGADTYIGKSCLAAFPFLIVEFDEMPLEMQYAFWRGFALHSKFAPSLIALTYSGGKSLHGVLHVGCRTLAQWEAARDKARGVLSSDADVQFRADVQAMEPRQGTRIAGVKRSNNGAVQSLIYLNPKARQGTMWIEPKGGAE